MQRVPRPASPEDAVYHPRCRTARAAPAAAERTRSRAPRELARPHGRPITPTPHHLSLLLHASVEQGNEAADRGGGTSGYVPRIEKTSWAKAQFTTATFWPGAQWRQPCARLGLGLCLAEAAGSRQAGPLTPSLRATGGSAPQRRTPGSVRRRERRHARMVRSGAARLRRPGSGRHVVNNAEAPDTRRCTRRAPTDRPRRHPRSPQLRATNSPYPRYPNVSTRTNASLPSHPPCLPYKPPRPVPLSTYPYAHIYTTHSHRHQCQCDMCSDCWPRNACRPFSTAGTGPPWMAPSATAMPQES